MSNLVQNPFPIFTDSNGLPLEDGFIFIGIAGLSPISNPLQAYWDAELSIPANDIRTKGGYPANSGTPGRIYTGVNYSIVVQDKRGATLYTQNNAIDFFSGAAEVAVQGVAGEVISANDVVYFAPDGLLYIADSSDITKSIIAGVSVADVLAGAFVTAQRTGILSTFSGLTVGSSYYLSSSGTTVLKSALAASDEVVFIGVATTLSALDIDTQTPESSKVIINAVLGETIAAGIPVYYAATGKLLTASKDDVAESFVVGITLEAGDLDDTIKYQKIGITPGFTGLTAGTRYFLGDAGAIVVAASVTGTDVGVSLGVAISATEIDVNVVSSELIGLIVTVDLTVDGNISPLTASTEASENLVPGSTFLFPRGIYSFTDDLGKISAQMFINGTWKSIASAGIIFSDGTNFRAKNLDGVITDQLRYIKF